MLLIPQNCIFIKGYARSIIYDLGRNNFNFIPNDLFELITSNVNNISNIDNIEYYQFLIENEYIYEIPNEFKNNFTKLDLSWDANSLITNAVLIFHLEIEKSINHLTDKLFCKHFFIIILDILHLELIYTILNKFSTSNIYTFNIVIDVKTEINYDLLEKLSSIDRVLNIHVTDNITKLNNEKLIKFDKHKTNFYYNNISIDYFNINIQLFTESQLHNTYFNRKVCIDAEGNIKNSPEHEHSFGNIKDTTIEEAIEKPGFKDLWFIHKEMIDVCKDCEFRHMCVDACIPLQRADGSWYRSQECNYNPYICKWDDEEGYQNLASCGVVCNADGYSIDHEKIASINQVLWEEDE
jgi:SPASM domain peptide maturase of grasp-with-spasm system